MQCTHGAQVGEKTIVELLRFLILSKSVPLKDQQKLSPVVAHYLRFEVFFLSAPLAKSFQDAQSLFLPVQPVQTIRPLKVQRLARWRLYQFQRRGVVVRLQMQEEECLKGCLGLWIERED